MLTLPTAGHREMGGLWNVHSPHPCLPLGENTGLPGTQWPELILREWSLHAELAGRRPAA